MATPLDPKQVVSFEDLWIFKVVQQEALTRLLIAKGIFTKDEFLEKVRVVDQERKAKGQQQLPLSAGHISSRFVAVGGYGESI